MKESAFDASVGTFEFSGNTVDSIDSNALSVGCLDGSIINNVFKSQSGSPFIDFGPDPVCTPEEEVDDDPEYEDEAQYR